MSVISTETNVLSGRGASIAPRPGGQLERHGPDPERRAPGPERSGPSGPEVVPARAPGLELLGDLPGSGYRQPPGLVRRADGQTCQLTRLLYLILEAADGRRSYAEIAAVLTEKTSRLVTADNVRTLAEAKLVPLGLLQPADGSAPAAPRSNPLLALRFRLVVSNPRVTRRITAPFAVLFRPLVVAVVLAAFVASTGWLLFDKGLAAATRHAFDEPGLLLLVFAITVVSAGFHEFGHAAACRYGGATPGAMGVGLYLVWPAFYTNVDDSYRLGRGGRIRVDLGGLYFNAIVAVAMFAAWAVTSWDALLLIIAAQVLQMLRQLAPLVRFDGYHILADLTGVPDLYARIRPTLLGLLPSRWKSPESKVLKPWARVVVTIWVLTVVPLLLLTLVLIVATLPRVAGTAWQSLQHHATVLVARWVNGEVAGVGAAVLSIIAIALPLLGIAYLLIRLVRQTVRSVWRATAGRPKRRAAAIVAGGALVAALAWAWWPDGPKYQPIQPHERGALADALPTANRLPAPPPVDPSPEVGQRGIVTTVWPRTTPPPPEEQKRLALVLVPRDPAPSASGTPAPAWVFPFDPPEAPRPGDNQALAVNTRDGSTVYDVVFALVWATGDTVDNKNEAYALASCRGCQTVAVAFQVVLVVGSADVVIPENISAAVNYSCQDCVTYALASQLVVTLPEDLSAEAKDRLAALWAEIEEFSRNLRGLTPQQIEARLASYKAEILAIIRADSASAQPSGTPTTAAPQGSPSATTNPPSPGTPGPSGPSTGAPGPAPTASAPAAEPSVPAAPPESEAAATPETTGSASSEPVEPAPAVAPEEPSPAP